MFGEDHGITLGEGHKITYHMVRIFTIMFLVFITFPGGSALSNNDSNCYTHFFLMHEGNLGGGEDHKITYRVKGEGNKIVPYLEGEGPKFIDDILFSNSTPINNDHPLMI